VSCELNSSTRPQAFQRRIGKSERLAPLGESGTGLAVLLHGHDQVIELGAVRSCLAVEEKVEVLRRRLGLGRGEDAARYSRGAGAGSPLTMVSCSRRPMSPAAIRSCTSRNDGSKRRLKPTSKVGFSPPISTQHRSTLREI
jgi:hypothetical protein